MIERNIKLFKMDNFFFCLYPITILLVVYLESITNSYATAMLMISITSLTTSVMEIPTGVFSDKVGRRKTLIYSGIIFFLATVLYALAGSYTSIPALIMGSVLIGISTALSSGTDEALMYETAEEMGQKENFNLIYASSGYWIQIGLLCAAIIGAITTYYYDMVVLAWVAVIVILPCCVLRFFYVEPKLTKTKRRLPTLRHLRKAARELWRNKRLRFYAIVNIFDFSISDSSGRFESAYFAGLVPLWLVNVARMVKQFFGAIGFLIVPKIKHFGSTKILFSSMIGHIFIRLGGLFMNSIYTPFIFGLGNVFYSTTTTATTNILHQEFTAHQRATMKSIMSFAGNIMGALIMFLLGMLADETSPMMAILVGVMAKAVIVILSLNILKNKKGQH